MVNDVVLTKILRIFLAHVPIFVLTVIAYGLGLSIMRDTVSSASIAVLQFEGDGVSLIDVFNGVIAMGAINLFVLLALFIVGSVFKYWSLYTLILGIANLLFNLISEALFFRFATCYNFPSNAIVVARSSLAILLMILMLGVALFVLIHFLKHGKSRREKLGALLAPLLILPSIVMLVLNAILIAQLRPQLNYHIQPSSLRMGFFSPLEISQIQSESYAKTSTFDQQVIGNLGDVIYSSNIVGSPDCPDSYDNCTRFYYLYKYLYQIPCSSQSVQFYKDCANASNLTIYVTSKRYSLEPESTISYNCLVNQANETCASLCTQLLSNYQLILVQEFKPNHVQAAWTGLSNCKTKLKSQLIHDSALNPCSHASLKPTSEILITIAFIGIVFSNL
jgi:hypothetical protein